MKNKILLFLSLALCLTLHAEPKKLPRDEATELYLALSSIDAGFSPANTIAAADNLNALRPHVDALDKGKQAFNRAVQAIAKQKPADAQERVNALTDSLEVKAAEEIAVDLTPLSITDEEITAAKVRPAALASIRRWLKPKK